ncbi:MAG: YdeI/OmpD-associated family protein [Actinomycetota bacterium]
MEVPDLERVQIERAGDLWDWLREHHGREDAVLIVTFKKAVPDRYVSRDEVLDALVAHGWVDGRRFALDHERTMQLVSPRRQDRWAATYLDRFARLELEGRVHPAGRSALERAYGSGLVDERAHVDRLDTPADLERELRRRNAIHWWETSASSYRRNVLRWVASAKRAETRDRRIDRIVDHASRGEKVPNY